MIVVDGRTDAEKLNELLAAGAEETCLDFKATLDLSAKASKAVLDFVKDVVAMGNLAEGGYLVVGVDDRGAPAHDQAALNLAHFDSSTLRSKVARYVEAPVHLVSQPHTLDARDVVLIYVPPNPDGLPVPMKCDGEFDRDGTGSMAKVFREGEVLIREGTSNVRLRYSHWNGLLERYRATVRDEARADADALIHRVVEALKDSTPGARAVPLDLAMTDAAFTDALLMAFEASSLVRVRQFLNTAQEEALTTTERDTWSHVLNRIALVAGQGAVHERRDVYEAAVTCLRTVYDSTGLPGGAVRLHGTDAEIAQRLLDVLLRVMAVGSLVVREKAWDLLGSLALQPVEVSPTYRYTSWLRHGAVYAARAGLLQGDDGGQRGGQLISLARALVTQVSGLRPDRAADVALPDPDALPHADWLLNSLCQFDLWWCLCAAVSEPSDRTGARFYPSCAAFNQHRSQPVLDLIATNKDARHRAFAGASDVKIAAAIVDVVNVAVTQSHQYGGWWDGLRDSDTVGRFIERNQW